VEIEEAVEVVEVAEAAEETAVEATLTVVNPLAAAPWRRCSQRRSWWWLF
jgi:hypothetical protein